LINYPKWYYCTLPLLLPFNSIPAPLFMTSFLLLVVSFFVIAIIYSSVGFGGGSSYLALLALPIFALTPAQIRPTALLCNVIVVTGGVVIFYREKHLSWKEALPYFLLSVPLAFIGGLMKLKNHDFFILLSSTLILAALFLWVQPSTKEKEVVKESGFSTKLLTGGAIGFLSGLVSIGGGIFLSPIMHFFRWHSAKKISAIASVFILVNSLGGLWGQFYNGAPNIEWKLLLPLLGAVFLGGQIGSRLGARKFNPLYIKRITAFVIFVAGIIILKEHW
jgi:uncharacterized protein